MKTLIELKKYLVPLHLSGEEERIILVIAEGAKQVGKPAYIVGGFVRDKLLNRSTNDLDITIVGSGVQLAEWVANKLGRSSALVVYKNFGTALLKEGGFEIEFVGARKESYRADSRKPMVEDGTLMDDLKRRDLTINALAVSINDDDYGMLLDAFKGLNDLEKKVLKTPLNPEITFADDPLRMLRTIRFAAELNFKIEANTFRAITRSKERISIISAERVSDELNKIILAPRPSIGFDLLFKSGLLKIIFPEMEKLYGVENQEGKGHKDNFYHTLQVLDNLATRSEDLWLRWAAVLHDIAKPDTKKFEKGKGWTFHGHEVVGARKVEKIFRQLHLPLNEKMKFVQKLVLLHLRPISLSDEEVTDAAIRRLLFEAGDDIDTLMMLCESDITSKNEKKVQRYLTNFQVVREKLQQVEEKDKIRNWQPPITGDHIMQIFAKPPGKNIGILKDAVREAILDGVIENNYDSAYQYLLRIAEEQLHWKPIDKN